MAEQRSPEWYAERLGKVTASRVGDILKTIKNGDWAASRKNYKAELVIERLTGDSPERFFHSALEWGVEQEPLAREAYRNRTGFDVLEVGFVEHPTLTNAGASPDGLVGEEGLLEIKCPIPATHIDTLINESVFEQYKYQMLWQLACTGRKWCDFVSYHPWLPEDMQLFIKRFERDEEEIERVEHEVKVFLKEVEDTVNELKLKYREPSVQEENW